MLDIVISQIQDFVSGFRLFNKRHDVDSQVQTYSESVIFVLILERPALMLQNFGGLLITAAPARRGGPGTQANHGLSRQSRVSTLEAGGNGMAAGETTQTGL